ncbi:MAG: hypothetical protein NT045_06605 [Candidatus Aureabacteria bacterium]|nr:hypothetical protein [Candidatus Auribacterota bacterium]
MDLRGMGHGGGIAALIAILAALTCILFAPVLTHPGMVPWSPHSDYTGFLLSRTAFVAGALLENGALPLWRPVESCGIPTLGNPQIGVFYPPNLLVLALGPVRSLGLRFILCVFLGGLFAYAYAREIGLGWCGGVFAGIAFMLSGFMATNIYAGHIQHLSTVIWFPLCLFFSERLARRARLPDAVGLGIALAFQWNAGHPEYFVYSSCATGLYLALLLRRGRVLTTLSLLVLAGTLFALLSAVQIFPTLEFVKLMTRGKEGYAFASGGSLPPPMLGSLFFPSLLGSLTAGTYWGPIFYWEGCMYVGVVTIVLAAAGAFCTRAERSKPLLLLAFFSLLFAFGRYTPLHSALSNLLPFLLKFRMPSRMLFVYSLAVAVLAGMGFEWALCAGNVKRFAAFIWSTFIAGGALLIIFRYFPQPVLASGRSLVRFKFNLDSSGAHTMSLAEWQALVPAVYLKLRAGVTVWPLFPSLAIMAILFSCRRRALVRTPLFAAGILLLLCVELLSFAIPYVGVADPTALYPRTRIIDYLSRDKDYFRVMDFSGALGLERMEPYGIQMALNSESGFVRWYADLLSLVRFKISPLAPGRGGLERLNRDFQTPARGLTKKDTLLELINRTTRYRVSDFEPIQNGLKIMNVKYVVLNNRIDDQNFELACAEEGIYLYRFLHALPRAFVVGAVECVNDELAACERLAAFDPASAAIIAGDGKGMAGGQSYRPAEILDYRPDEILCRVAVEKACYLVLSEVWYPDWEAYDNGARRPVVRIDHALRGVALAPGAHRVRFRYNPSTYRLGRMLSLGGIALSFALIVFSKRRHG